MRYAIAVTLMLLWTTSLHAQQTHHEKWGQSRAEVEAGWESDDLKKVIDDENMSCYDWAFLEARICLFFVNDKYYRFAMTDNNLTPKGALKKIIELSQKYGEPEAYKADNTEVNTLELAVSLAESSVDVIFPVDKHNTRPSAIMRVSTHPEDDPGTVRLATSYEDVELAKEAAAKAFEDFGN